MGIPRCGANLFATYSKIEYAILSKQLSAGEKLPSVREMAKLLHISPNTVMKAYTHLKHLELVVSPTNRHYSVIANEQYIFQKREESEGAKLLIFKQYDKARIFQKEATDF